MSLLYDSFIFTIHLVTDYSLFTINASIYSIWFIYLHMIQFYEKILLTIHLSPQFIYSIWPPPSPRFIYYQMILFHDSLIFTWLLFYQLISFFFNNLFISTVSFMLYDSFYPPWFIFSIWFFLPLDSFVFTVHSISCNFLKLKKVKWIFTLLPLIKSHYSYRICAVL